MKKTNVRLIILLFVFSLNFLLVGESFAITTREQMMTIAESYANHTWVPTENNVCSYKCCAEWNEEGKCAKEMDCVVNTPDRNTHTDWSSDKGWKWEKDESGNYLQNVGVPYQWGGSSSIEVGGITSKNMLGFGDFDIGVENKKCAGDARGNGSKSSYAVGVDCSGFISRAWNLKYKKSTCSLPNISKEVGEKFRFDQIEKYQEMKKGDIFNIYSYHVMLSVEDNPFSDMATEALVYESSGHDWKTNVRGYTFKQLTHNNVSSSRSDEPYTPRTSFPSEADVEIVVDASFSMWGENLEKAKEVMNYFVNSYESNARIGVVGFSNSASAIYPLTMLKNEQIRSDIKETTSDYLDSHFGGKTYIAKGLELARKELNKDANSNSPKIIILISDGYESPEDISDPEYVSINNVISQIAQDGIIIHTIRAEWQTSSEPQLVLVDQENPSSLLSPKNSKSGKLDYQAQSMIIIPDLDQSDFSEAQAITFLKMIAANTSGRYKSISDLESFLNTCRETVYDFYGLDRTLKTIYGEISPSQTIYKEFFVDPSIETATFALFWPGSELNFSLIRPDGIEITSDSISNDVSFFSSDTFKIYKVDAPMNGLWQFKIYGKEVSDDGENYAISISGLSGIDLDVSFDKEKYSPNSVIKISASVIDQILDIPEDQYVYGAEVKAEVKDPNGNLYNIDLPDIDNDGIYTGEFSETSIIGQYDFTVEFNGKSNVETNDPFTREKTISTVVVPNLPPIAEAGEPISGHVSFPVEFDSSKSYDPEGQPLKYRWDFDSDSAFDIEWSNEAIVHYTYWNFLSGLAILDVSDGVLSSTDTVEVNIKSANDLKKEAVSYLENISAEEKPNSNAIKIAIKFINKSLNEDLWQDSSRLNPQIKSGAIVFDMEKFAVLSLENVIKRNTASKEQIKSIIEKIIKADQILARVSIKEADGKLENISDSVKSKIAENKLEKAKNELEKAEEYYTEENYSMAIDRLKLAWIFSQQAKIIIGYKLNQ